MNASSQIVSTSRKYTAIREHLISDLDSKAVILSLKNGKYYGLNSVGVAIWTLIQTPSTIDEIESALMARYDVDEEICRLEVTTFLETLVSEGLIKVDEK